MSLARAAAATYATNVLVAGLSLLNVLLVARALGPEGRGEVALLTVMAGLTAAVATLGVEQAVANVAARRPEARRSLATTALVLALVLGAAGAAAVSLLVWTVPAAAGGTPEAARVLALLAVPLVVFKIYLDFLVRADYGVLHANSAWAAEAVVNVGVNATLWAVGGLTVGRALGAWVAGQALAMLILIAFVAGRSVGFGRPQAALARETVGFGLKTHGGRVLTLGNYKVDQWIVGGVAGARELGLYSVAVAWSEALFFLPTALTLVQRPDLIRAGPREAAKRAAAAARSALLLTVPATVAFVLLAPFLCVAVFGDEFRGSVDDLRVLVWGAAGIVLLKVLGNALIAQGAPLRATAGVAVSFAATIVLDIVLIPEYGGLGAAIASTAAYLAGGIVTAVLFARALGARPADLVPRRDDLRVLARAARALRRA